MILVRYLIAGLVLFFAGLLMALIPYWMGTATPPRFPIDQIDKYVIGGFVVMALGGLLMFRAMRE